MKNLKILCNQKSKIRIEDLGRTIRHKYESYQYQRNAILILTNFDIFNVNSNFIKIFFARSYPILFPPIGFSFYLNNRARIFKLWIISCILKACQS